MASTGARVLTRRADLERLKQQLPPVSRVLIIDATACNADVLTAVLNAWFGYGTSVEQTSNTSGGLDALQERSPDLVFLSDGTTADPDGDAIENISFLRRWGFHGPIIVISASPSRTRRGDLARSGAAGFIDRDDLSTTGLGELLLELNEKGLLTTD